LEDTIFVGQCYDPAFNVSVSLGVYSRHTCLQAAQPLSIPRTVGPGHAERCMQTGRTDGYAPKISP